MAVRYATKGCIGLEPLQCPPGGKMSCPSNRSILCVRCWPVFQGKLARDSYIMLGMLRFGQPGNSCTMGIIIDVNLLFAFSDIISFKSGNDS